MEKNFPTFSLYDYKNLKCNFHTHTTRCKHAIGTEREYIESAIEAGFKVLGFSDHAPYLFEDNHISRIRMFMDELEGYVRTIEGLKKEYKEDIQIFTGLEMEYFPAIFEKTLTEIKKYPLDYLILGQHYLDGEISREYAGREARTEDYLKTYVQRVMTGLKTGNFLYVAHPDLVNYKGDAAVYEKYMRKLAKTLKSYNMPIELNVNGYSREYQYPSRHFIEIGVQEGCDFIVGVDAHVPQALLDNDGYQGCVQLAEALGGNVMWK